MNKSFFLGAVILVALSSCGKKTIETQVIQKDTQETLFASGYLEAEGTYSITSQTEGYLENIKFEEGHLVKTGQVLAHVNNSQNIYNSEGANALFVLSESNVQRNAPALLQAQNTERIKKQKMESDSIQAARYEKLYSLNSISLNDLENAQLQYKTAKAEYQNAKENYKLVKQQADQQLISNKTQKDINRVVLGENEIKVLYNGMVLKLYKQNGDFVRKGDVIATVGNPERIYAKVSIDEGSISKVRVGQTAVVKLNTDKLKTYQARVTAIYPSFDEASQSFLCKLSFIDTLDFKIVNTQLQCNIYLEEVKNALLIPRNYINYSSLVQVKGEKEMRKVVARVISTDWVIVQSGLQKGETIVTDNIK